MVQLNEKIVAGLTAPAAGNKVYRFSGARLQGVEAPVGFGVAITAAGVRSFVLNYRSAGAHRRMVIGRWPTWSALQAVREAKELRRRVDRGEDPLGARRHQATAVAGALKNICAEYFRRSGDALRTGAERRRDIERLVLPTLGSRPIEEIRRSEIVRLLDTIADENGPVMADRILAFLSRIMNWHASRSDTFRTPIVRGMGRGAGKPRARTLSDDEIRALWHARDVPPAYHALIKFLLFSAARRGEAAGMTREELRGADWTLPADRNKVGVDLLRTLPPPALAVLPPGDGRHVFGISGGFSRLKADLDRASGVTGWRVHDLRRTSRSLMSRAGVPSDHAERVLGHLIGGVRGTYDRHEYANEKARALEALAALVERIVNPVDNVRALRG